MTQQNTAEHNAAKRDAAQRGAACRYCTHCNVQTGMGWNPVYFCEREGHAASVLPEGYCGHFEREPGSDDA